MNHEATKTRSDSRPAETASWLVTCRRAGSPFVVHLCLWVISLPLILIGIGTPEVSRTQEARVLEVARQMLGRPAIDWIVPKINGDLRLQKPPLTYWMTALAYKIGGVSEGVGRIPTAICGWLTLAVVYAAGRWLFGARAGFLSAACLLGSYYFARHTRLAETDIPATLFVTLAIYALWRGSVNRDETGHKGVTSLYDQSNDPPAVKKGRDPFMTASRAWVGWMHLVAFAIGMSIMCKGAPGAFAILFLLAYAVIERSARPIRRFIVSGAPLTLALIALPWFLFVGHHEGWETFIFELRNVEAGTDHGAPVYQYAPWIVIGTLPWSVVSIVAIPLACREWRRDARVRGMLIWMAAITLPLCITANKQSHYLIPELPIVMLLTGWIVDRSNNRVLIGAAVVCAVILPPIVTLLIPRLSNEHTRDTAQFVREHFDDSPLCFYGQNQSVPLCFNLRRPIPFANDDAELTSFIARQPDMVIMTIGKDKRPATAPGADQFEHLTSGKWEDQVWDFYRVRR